MYCAKTVAGAGGQQRGRPLACVPSLTLLSDMDFRKSFSSRLGPSHLDAASTASSALTVLTSLAEEVDIEPVFCLGNILQDQFTCQNSNCPSTTNSRADRLLIHRVSFARSASKTQQNQNRGCEDRRDGAQESSHDETLLPGGSSMARP